MAPTKIDVDQYRENLKRYSRQKEEADRNILEMHAVSSVLIEFTEDFLLNHHKKLINDFDEIYIAYEDATFDKETHAEQSRQIQRQLQKLKRELAESKRAFERDNSVLVLIDGDGMLFDDSYIQDGEEGGYRAAQDLYRRVQHYIDDFGYSPDVKIVARVYANLDGLCKTYGLADIASHNTIVNFARGFTKARAYFDFIDCGAGKERADNKIAAWFNLYLNNIQTRHIVIGCSHDNGYVRLLDELPQDTYDKITLLEGIPFAREYSPFEGKINREKFAGLFRESKLDVSSNRFTEAKRVNSGPGGYESPNLAPARVLASNSIAQPETSSPFDTPSRSASTPASESGATRLPVNNPVGTTGGGSSSWAGKAMNAVSLPQTSTLPKSEGSLPANRLRFNREGQRIDPPKPNNLDKDTITRVQGMKLCNNLYLKGYCARRYQSPPTCIHEHDYDPSRMELEALRHIARRIPCVNRTKCEDPECTAGHRCPFISEGSCPFQQKGVCKFGNDFHHNDTIEAKTTVIGKRI